MKKLMRYAALCSVLVAISATEPGAAKLEPIHISIILDLSNRIKSSDQINRDKALIGAIFDEFQTRQKKQSYLLSKDRIHLFLAYQPNSNIEVGDVGEIFMNKTPYPVFENKKIAFLKEVNELYKNATKEPQTGADIYTSICSGLPGAMNNSKTKQKIFIITDGYLLFDKEYLSKRAKCTYMRKLEEMRSKKEKWKSFYEKEKLQLCPCADLALQNTSVMMLEVANKYKGQSPFEFSMIKHYWTDWFNKMKIPAIIIQHGAKKGSAKDAILEFLNED